MSRKLTFWDIPSVISLPESGSGAMPCAVPDGPIPALSGREAALASLSARQAKERGLLTSGTFGPRSTISSASADLQSCLASRLQAVTALHGSTLYKLTWKRRVTPAGRWIPALRASVRRTSGKDCIGWPTPKAAEAGPDFAIHTRKGSGGMSLQTAVQLAGWVTPSARDWKDTPGMATERQDAAGSVTEAGNSGGMENSCGHGRQARWEHNNGDDGGQSGAASEIYKPGPTDGYWRNADWLLCRDGKWRPVEPGTFPLAHGATNRVGRLRGYGNAIVAPQAEAFIRAYLELEQDNLQRNTVENK